MLVHGSNGGVGLAESVGASQFAMINIAESVIAKSVAQLLREAAAALEEQGWPQETPSPPTDNPRPVSCQKVT